MFIRKKDYDNLFKRVGNLELEIEDIKNQTKIYVLNNPSYYPNYYFGYYQSIYGEIPKQIPLKTAIEKILEYLKLKIIHQDGTPEKYILEPIKKIKKEK